MCIWEARMRRHTCADCAYYYDGRCNYWNDKAVEWDLCGRWEKNLSETIIPAWACSGEKAKGLRGGNNDSKQDGEGGGARKVKRELC